MFPSPRINSRMAQVVDAAIRLRSHHRQSQANNLLASYSCNLGFIERVLTCPHQRRALSRP